MPCPSVVLTVAVLNWRDFYHEHKINFHSGKLKLEIKSYHEITEIASR